MILQIRPKDGVRNGGSYRWYHSKKPLTTHRPQIPTRPVHAEYTLGRLPAPVVLYERKALRSAKDTTGTTRGWAGGSFSVRAGTGTEEGICVSV